MATPDPLLRPRRPLDLVVIPRERLEDAFEDAVAHGRIAREDAADLVRELLRRAVTAPVEQMVREVDRARWAPPRPPSPIAAYDELTSAQVGERLAGLSPAQLRQVRDYERRNANRKSVLAAIAARLA
jgi:hypothetical protein